MTEQIRFVASRPMPRNVAHQCIMLKDERGDLAICKMRPPKQLGTTPTFEQIASFEPEAVLHYLAQTFPELYGKCITKPILIKYT